MSNIDNDGATIEPIQPTDLGVTFFSVLFGKTTNVNPSTKSDLIST